MKFDAVAEFIQMAPARRFQTYKKGCSEKRLRQGLAPPRTFAFFTATPARLRTSSPNPQEGTALANHRKNLNNSFPLPCPCMMQEPRIMLLKNPRIPES
jgi:hypothetical protein